ncbi:GNAT family N-acetyltransferase [Romboutsia ilealis]|nr:GNAT family protein [Romboutsia ilealis]
MTLATVSVTSVAQKYGFVVEGVLKNEIFKDGKYYDEIIMSIFKD